MNIHHFRTLPVFMHDPLTRKILLEAKAAIPPGTRVYLVGGAARNAVYYRLFHKKLPQRDFDVVVLGDFHRFIKNLRSRGFIYGKIRRKRQIVVKIKKVKKPKHKLEDYLWLDLKSSQEKTMAVSLQREANFTINGFAIPLKSITEAHWYTKTIKLPTALKDLKEKRLRVNSYTSHSYNLFAALRFMSKGFKAPPPEEVQLLVKAFFELDTRAHKRRYKRNLEKLYGYVGGKNKARKLLRKLGLQSIIPKL